MCIYTIYRSTNIINNKVYIGFDSAWPKRKQDHKSSSKYDDNNKFYNAIRKYGWDNFVWEILYQSMDYLHTLNVMEPSFINEYDSLANGYNTDIGGIGGHLGATWWNNGTKNALSIIKPGLDYVGGRLPFNTVKGTVWWNNGVDSKMSAHSPGQNWVLGRLISDKYQEKQRIYYKNPILCVICNNPIPYDTKHQKVCSTECNSKNRSRIAKKPRNRNTKHR